MPTRDDVVPWGVSAACARELELELAMMMPAYALTNPVAFLAVLANLDHDPDGPRSQSVDEDQRQVFGKGAARALDLARPSTGHCVLSLFVVDLVLPGHSSRERKG